jgi:hypothetical protein
MRPAAHFRRRNINADLDEMRAESRLLVLLMKISVFDGIFRTEAALSRGFGQWHATIAGANLAFCELGLS